MPTESVASNVKRPFMLKTTAERNKALVLEAFDTLFNKRDYAAAERYWSDPMLTHAAVISYLRRSTRDLSARL